MKARNVFVAAVVGFTFTGCTLFAGLTEDRELRANQPDAATGSGGGGTLGDGATTGSGGASTGGLTGTGGVTLGSGGIGGAATGGSPGDGGPPNTGGTGGGPPDAGPHCAKDDGRCTGLLHETCDATGKWSSGTSCPYVCDPTAGCGGECVPAGNPQCKADGVTPQHCDATGTWKDDAACANGCDPTAGICYICTPKAKDCSGAQPRLCLDDGKQWVPNGAVCTGMCVGGACTTCTAGDPARCNVNVVQTCDATGNWKTSTTCTGTKPACTKGACSVCQPNATKCTGTTPQSCNLAGTAWVNGTVKKGTCSAVCDPTTTQCVGSLYETCDATGKWSAGAVTIGKCNAVCTPNSTQCVSPTTPQTCNTTGTAWVSGAVTAGTCGAVCSPGNTSTCSAVYGSLGNCAGGTVACDSTGHWTACPIGPSTELCDSNGADEDCDGNGFNGCTCQNGQSTGCGPCGDGVSVCNNGQWGGCQGGTSPQTYYRDADGDGWCNPSDSASGVAYQNPPRCGPPGGYISCSCSSNCDCFDGNGSVASDCNDYEIWGPDYGKGCCGGPEDIPFGFDCGAGWHSIDCHTQRLSGGSNGFWIDGWDNGVQSGQCTVHYSLQGLEGVEGRGIIVCRPDGL